MEFSDSNGKAIGKNSSNERKMKTFQLEIKPVEKSRISFTMQLSAIF